MLSSKAATNSAEGIFFGVIAKFIPFCNTDFSVSVSGFPKENAVIFTGHVKTQAGMEFM